MSLPSSRYVRSDESDQAGSVVLSDETGGDISISLVGMGAGRLGGGIEEVGMTDVGDGVLVGCNVKRFGLDGTIVEGLSSGVGVDTGEGVS